MTAGNEEDLMRGRIVRGRGGLYTVRDGTGTEWTLRAKKKFRRQGISPLVGDRVLFTPGRISDEHGWVEEIETRDSVFVRPPVANVSMICAVVSCVPETDWLLVDKLLFAADRQKVKAVIAVTKCDLDQGKTAAYAARCYQGICRVFEVSGLDGTGLDALRECFAGQEVCFAGQSGAGKSTLLNAMYALQAETGNISEKIARGKNTTRHTELFLTEEGAVFDTPGFNLLESEEILEPEALQLGYPDFAPYRGKCYFDPCCHQSEPGCAVKDAVEKGEIDPDRYGRYLRILDSCRVNWRNRYD